MTAALSQRLGHGGAKRLVDEEDGRNGLKEGTVAKQGRREKWLKTVAKQESFAEIW